MTRRVSRVVNSVMLNRRKFLLAAGATAVTAAVPHVVRANSLNTDRTATGRAPGSRTADGRLLLIGRCLRRLPQEDLTAAEMSELLVFNENLELQKKIFLPLHAHSFLQDPYKTNLIYCLPRQFGRAAIVDLDSGVVTQELRCPGDHKFWGHGIVGANGDLIAGTVLPGQKKGALVHFRRGSLVKVTPTDFYLHEIALAPEDSSVVIIASPESTGRLNSWDEGSSLKWVNLDDGRVIKSVASNLRSGGHFRFLGETSDRILLMGQHEFPAVEIHDRGRVDFIGGPELVGRTAWHPLPDLPETLNIAFDPIDPNFAWITVPMAYSAFRVDLQKKRVVEVLRDQKIRHAFATGSQIILGCDKLASGSAISLNGNHPPRLIESLGNSQHVTAIRRA